MTSLIARLGAVLACTVAAACAGDPQPGIVTPEQRALLETLRYDHAPPAPDPSNRVADDGDARLLGQRLFFDPSLSGPLIEGDNDGGPATLGVRGEAGRVSCAGCHLPDADFVDTRSPHRQISLAAAWTQRRTPTLLDVAFAPLYNWDGRRDSLWGQALGVMESAAELNSGRLFVAQQVFRTYRAEYEEIFGEMPALDDARFGALTPEQAGCIERMTREGVVHECRGKPEDAADYDALSTDDQALVTTVAVNASKAIAAYVRLLRCGEGRFDAWLDGDDSALDESEQRGAALFVGRAHCIDCHSGPRLTDDEFHNVGLAAAVVAVTFIDADDPGAAEGIAQLLQDPLNTRGVFSDGDRGVLPERVDDSMLGAFRTPTLRCIASQPSFMHTAQMRSLEQVVSFFNRGGDDLGNYPGHSEIDALDLSDEEQADLVAFLQTLQGPGAEAALRQAPSAAP